MEFRFWDWILGAIFLLFLGYLYLKRKDAYFTKRGVKKLSGYFPILEDFYPILSGSEHMKDTIQRSYDAFPDERYFGFRLFPSPLLIVKDLDLIKQIAVKDFDSFTDHYSVPDPDSDIMFAGNLIALRGERWREMRSTLSPAFTSFKIRGMFQYMVECGEQMAEFYSKELNRQENKAEGILELEMKDAFTRCTTDVIASCAFGLKVNSLEEPSNEFYMMGKDMSNSFSGWVLVKILLMQLFPKISKYFSASFLPAHVGLYFRQLVLGTMNDREEKNIARPDLIQILMDVKKGTLKDDVNNEEDKEIGSSIKTEPPVRKTDVKRQWTDDELVSQAITFLIGGFESVATLLRFTTYELVRNPHLQKKLQKEIDIVSEKSDGKLKYGDLQSMKYMDMFISEVLRIWPPSIIVDHKCVKPYLLPPPNSQSDTEFQLLPENGVIIPVYSIQHDPMYFKDPETFDPERFSDENKKDIHPCTFMPFGIGPRICIAFLFYTKDNSLRNTEELDGSSKRIGAIPVDKPKLVCSVIHIGSRFALTEAKAVIFHLLRKFDLVATAKTEIPVKLKTENFNLDSKAGFWIGLKSRQTD